MIEINMKKDGNCKRGQVTIFIILAVMIVSVVLVFFLWVKPTYFQKSSKKLGFDNCVKDAVNQAIPQLEKNAGFINPEFTYPYNGEKFTYLCYTNEFYKTCTVQVPFLKNKFAEQMKLLIKDNINTCYDSSVSELKSRGYDVSSGDVDYDVLINPGVIQIEINAPTIVGSQSFSKFNVDVNSPIYDMLMISTSILQFESRYGDSDTSSMISFYPEYMINKIKRGDGTTVYTVDNKDTGDKFQFASRSLVFPAGYAL